MKLQSNLIFFVFCRVGLKDQGQDLSWTRSEKRLEKAFLMLTLVHFDNCFPRILQKPCIEKIFPQGNFGLKALSLFN